VSVIVPTRNSAPTLVDCLASVRAQRDADVELIVVDNRSDDATVAIAHRYADLVLDHGPERSAQRNAGARRANGDLVVFVDSDMVLGPTVCAEAAASLAGSPHVGALVLPEVATGEGFWASCRTLEKELYLGDPNVEAARAFRPEVLAAVGGWDERLTACEDWDLEDRVRAAGWAIGRVEARVVHQEGRIRLGAQFHKKRYYGRWAAAYVARGHGARRVGGRALFRRPARLARDPGRAVGLVVLKGVEAAGMLAGAAEAAWRR
jgi:glycosyltransferase involved in cell wall biosynthesis